MNSLAKENMNISVENLNKISETDLADLCNITEQAIKAGGGFGWLTIPPIENLKRIGSQKKEPEKNVRKKTLESEAFYILVKNKIEKTSGILKLSNQ